MIDASPGFRMWLYKRQFQIGSAKCMVTLDARSLGLFSTLWIDGVAMAQDATPAAGPEAIRNHRLVATLPGGRALDVKAGYCSMTNTAIAVRVDGILAHESHPGRTIAYPARMARMVAQQTRDGRPAYDSGNLSRNKVPILVDIATGLLFFIVAKLTDLKTAALVGAAVGISLLAIQRFVKIDLIGGLALFGIFMLLLSAGFAMAFEDDELIKQRSTIIGVIGAACFLGDGLVLKGRRLGRGLNRYMAYNDVDDARLAISLGLVGLTMAGSNALAVGLLSTDGWLFYTTFADIPLSIALVLLAIKWARGPSAWSAAPA